MNTVCTTRIPALLVGDLAAGDTLRVVRRSVRPADDGFWDVDIEIRRVVPDEPRVSWGDLLRIRFLLGVIRFRGRIGL